MTDTGFVVKQSLRSYEDYPSLKKYIKSYLGSFQDGTARKYYDQTTITEFITNFNVTTTGATADLIEADDGIAISKIGKTEVTLELSAADDDASHNTVVFSLTWEDADGNEYTSEATGTAALNGTPVAFATPVSTSVYQVTAFTASADFDNHDVYAMVNGGKTYATITAAGTVTASTEAQLFGVGDIYGRAHTEHANLDSKIFYMEYLTAAGLIKYAICTLTTTSADEIRFIEGTYSAATDLVTAGTIYVKDFYRLRRLWGVTTPTSNSHEFILTDDACGNLDGSGGDIFGIILEGQYESIHTTYQAPAGYDAWVAHICCQSAQSAPNDSYTIEINFKQDGGSIFHRWVREFVECTTWDPCILLEERTDVDFYVSDLATADNITGLIVIVEVARNS